MIDEERQAMFQGSFNHKTVTLRMHQRALVIQAQDSQTFSKFYTRMDRQLLDQQDMFFKSYFESPEDIFNYLTQHFSECIFEKNLLRFHYVIGKKTKEAIIELKQEKTDIAVVINIQMAKMKEQFAAQLEKKQHQIDALQSELKDLTRIFEQYKRDRTEKDQKNQKQLTLLSAYLLKEKNRSKFFEDKLAKEKEISKSAQEIKEKQRVMKQPMAILPKKINHHQLNPHKSQFLIIKSNDLSEIFRVGQNEKWYNFINHQAVLPKQTKYSIKLNNITNGFLMVGFCTEKGFGQMYNFQTAESAYYCFYGAGSMYDGGIRKSLQDLKSIEQSIQCIADMTENRFLWLKAGKTITQCAISAVMRGRPIYLSILMFYYGNSVEVTSF